jgi:hypothetical protein
MSDPWSGSGAGALASPFAPMGEERRTGCASRSEPADVDELVELDELDARGEWGEWSESDEWGESDEWDESDGNVEAYAGADKPEAGEELLEDESAIYAASLAAAEDSAPAYGEDWFVPIGIPTPTVPAPARPGPVTAAGAAIPIPVPPPPCVAVPALSSPERPCAGVDSTSFAASAAVAAFAGRIADCYANRMAQRRQRERHAKAQDQAVRQARAAKVPGETAAVRAQRIAAARAAVPAEPVETVRTDIRAKYLKFLEDEYRDTIIGAGNRPKARKRPQTCQFNTVSRQWMYGVREQLDFITLGTGGRGLVGFAPPPRPAGGDQLVDIEPPATTDGGAKVQPIMNAFLRELRARAPAHRAYNYLDHGGGAFNARGYSIDIELRGAKDERGFYPRPAAVQFLLAIDAAARAAGVEWRAIYNDYAVAATINQHLDRKRVIFVGKPRRGGRRIGLNWHGPLLLHFHVDITPRSP